MRKTVLTSVAICILSLASVAQAEVKFSCNPIKLQSQDKNIILAGPDSSGVAQVYFFKNTGTQGVWIDHPTHRTANAGWSSYVRTGHWSAFLLNRKNFEISCSVIQPGKVDNLNCANVISVCTPKEVSFKTPPKGSYWLAEDKSWDDIVKDVTRRGVAIK